LSFCKTGWKVFMVLNRTNISYGRGSHATSDEDVPLNCSAIEPEPGEVLCVQSSISGGKSFGEVFSRVTSTIVCHTLRKTRRHTPYATRLLELKLKLEKMQFGVWARSKPEGPFSNVQCTFSTDWHSHDSCMAFIRPSIKSIIPLTIERDDCVNVGFYFRPRPPLSCSCKGVTLLRWA
jgi:hypothetical protein